MIWIIAYIVSMIVSLSVLYYMGMNAPLGYEDEDGFHYGDNNN